MADWRDGFAGAARDSGGRVLDSGSASIARRSFEYPAYAIVAATRGKIGATKTPKRFTRRTTTDRSSRAPVLVRIELVLAHHHDERTKRMKHADGVAQRRKNVRQRR